MTFGDLDLDPEKILCEKIFWMKNIFWDLENFSRGRGRGRGQKNFDKKNLKKKKFWTLKIFGT